MVHLEYIKKRTWDMFMTVIFIEYRLQGCRNISRYYWAS